MMRSPADIVDAEAKRRQLPTPVRPYYPLGRDFAEACILAALLEARAEWEKANKENTKARQGDGVTQ